MLPAGGLAKLTPAVWLPLPQSPLKVNASVCPCPCAAVTLCAALTGLPSTVKLNCASPSAAVSDSFRTSVSAPVPTAAGVALPPKLVPAGVVPTVAVPDPVPDDVVPNVTVPLS